MHEKNHKLAGSEPIVLFVYTQMKKCQIFTMIRANSYTSYEGIRNEGERNGI